MSPRRACRKDANQDLFVDIWERLGFFVQDCSAVAQVIPGFPDVLLARRGILRLVEIKHETDVRPEQVIYHRKLEAHGIIVPICRTYADALAIAGARQGV
jgi:hypothetical protein